MATLDQLSMTEMEMTVLKHRAGLSQAEIAENERKSAKPEHNGAKMHAQYFGVSAFDSNTFLA